MKIKVDRFKSNSETTLSRIFIDGNFVCFGLEDEYRSKKVWGETRIPAGKYKIQFRKEGRFHEKYLEKFPAWHVGMLQVLNVPGFDYILIHIGNNEKDTAGCLLVGTTIKGWSLLNSTMAYENFYKQVAGALLNGEKVTIEYQDNDREDV